ncbi:MAG: thioredoxin family protein [Rhodospirillales bacterium]|jgi:thiol:disulfide interchange protein DsbD|nr:thioredoxin family protein [Rhodospirillales bacterium]
MRHWAWLLAALLAAAGMTGGPRVAAASERVNASLVAETATVVPGSAFWVALRLDIADGWHTYWRNPGDSGEPTRIDWRLPDGVSASEIHWPAPEAIPYGPLVNFGYHGTAWHLVKISVPPDWPEDQRVSLNAEASWLVCKDICIPEGAELSLELAAATLSMPASAQAAALAAARDRLPVPFAGSAHFAGTAAAGEGGLAGAPVGLTLNGPDPSGGAKSAYFFPYTWGAVDPAAPQRLERDSGGGLRLLMTAGSEPVTGNLAGVVVFNPERALDDPGRRAVAVEAAPDAAAAGARTVTPGASVPGLRASATAAGAPPGLIMAIGLALLGGLILNVMPCVFPVLSIKAMGVLRHASDPRALRASGLSYTAGVLVFVGLVAGTLIALKAAGQELGWGFQLQSPGFVAVMALLVFTLGLSLSGVFAIGGSMMGWGGGLAESPGGSVRGSFFTGALAALVATPCTAPFMGLALGFALTQPWPTALAIFLALGLGLALPYLALTFLPGAARLLPRPGPWMERLKQALAFPLYLTAAWLVWVLALQAGAGAVLALLVAMVLAAFAAWLNDIAHGLSGGRRGFARAACLAAGVGAVALALWPQVGAAPLPAAATAGSGSSATRAADPLAAESFTFARLEELRAAGTPVFVNLTAAWCITCQVNERLALSSPRVARVFSERGIVYLKGDWTNRDPEVTRMLEGFGRSGVPLYLFYRPGDAQAEILPQFLAESTVVEAVEGLPVIAGTLNRPKGG